MTRRPVAAALTLALAAAVGTVAVYAVIGDGAESTPLDEGSPPVTARATLTPRVALFGDTVRARVDVMLDRRRVDAQSVRVASAFSPWRLVGEPQRVGRDAGTTSWLATTFVLRCLASVCAPANETTELVFEPARVTYTAAVAAGGAPGVVSADWPRLVIHTRLPSSGGDIAAGPGSTTVPWRADLLSLPTTSYRVAPRALLVLLPILGGLLLIVAGALAYLAWPRRVEPPPPEPEPEVEPEPALTPLEHALALLESPAAEDGAADRRRALELVAEEVADRGERELARAARTLAWSADVPDAEKAGALAVRVRAALGGDPDAA